MPDVLNEYEVVLMWSCSAVVTVKATNPDDAEARALEHGHVEWHDDGEEVLAVYENGVKS